MRNLGILGVLCILLTLCTHGCAGESAKDPCVEQCQLEEKWMAEYCSNNDDGCCACMCFENGQRQMAPLEPEQCVCEEWKCDTRWATCEGSLLVSAQACVDNKSDCKTNRIHDLELCTRCRELCTDECLVDDFTCNDCLVNYCLGCFMDSRDQCTWECAERCGMGENCIAQCRILQSTDQCMDEWIDSHCE